MRAIGLGGSEGGAAAGSATAAGGGGLAALMRSPLAAAIGLNLGDASGNAGIAGILKKGPNWSDQDIKNWAAGAPMQLPGATPATPAGVMPYLPTHGRDVHSPQSGPYAYYPTKSAEVSVSGQADINQQLTIRVEPSSWFKAMVDAALQNSQTLVPLIGNGTGAMDSDAGPHRSGPAGIGRM
jgi:hypothetical protein